MSFQYIALVFEPTTFQTWVVTHNHLTRALSQNEHEFLNKSWFDYLSLNLSHFRSQMRLESGETLCRKQCDQIGPFIGLSFGSNKFGQISFFKWNHFWATFIDIWQFFSGHTGRKWRCKFQCRNMSLLWLGAVWPDGEIVIQYLAICNKYN